MRNREEFPYDPASIDALLVTHAHIDHTGRIPKLTKLGFKGKIYSTPPTKDFAGIMLEDSLGVIEKEAQREGNTDTIYTREDIEAALGRWEAVPYRKPFTVGDMTITMHEAGHILGSSMMEIVVQNKTFLFTGDLGNAPMPLLNPPEKVEGVNVLIIESAYGDREHQDAHERKSLLERAIEDTVKRGGVLLIPAFALERTQELLYEFNDLFEHGRVPRAPVFLDSPLSIKATAVYKKHQSFFNSEAKAIIRAGDDLFNFPGLHLTPTTDESKAMNEVRGPKIILAGAGMMQGGRIVHHARRYLGDKHNMILFIGYQAAGSLGRRILDGEKRVSIFGETVQVGAEVRSIHGYSAHADSTALLEFTRTHADTLERVFVVQGESAAALFLSQRIRDYLGITASAPRLGEVREF